MGSASGRTAGELLASQILASGDARGRSFAIVDKHRGEILIHASDGRLIGRSPALLGSALGDESIAGVGERTQRGALRAEDRTTPAGRFDARVGQNNTGERVVWVDWEAALAIHRLRDAPNRADRQRRLVQLPRYRRVTDGCIVVPGVFFDSVVLPALTGRPSVVYILPEQAGGPELLAHRPSM